MNRAVWRRWMHGLPTLMGLSRRGFFIPYRHAGSLPPAGLAGAYPPMEALFESCRPDFQKRLCGLGALPVQPVGARWDQDWFPRLDAAMAYALVRDRRPARIVEVGSGHSTRFMAAAIAAAGLKTRLTAIDPEPRSDIAATGAVAIRQTVPQCGEAPFAELGAGDMLFIDSSHVLMPGSDVDFLINRILPRLPPGALVHLHDIFLPDDYPASWAWRGYNEQLAVAAILAGTGYRVIFASHFVATRMASEVTASPAGAFPLKAGAIESSLWLEKIGSSASKASVTSIFR